MEFREFEKSAIVARGGVGAESQHPGKSERTMSLSGLHILLAEDNPTNQMVAIQMLESLGASVVLANDGAEALDLVQRDHYDLMLVDIEMPRVSGIEVIHALRAATGDLAQMPLIALTAYVMREHRVAIDEAGADGVIAKPILSIEQLGADILGFMAKRGAARKLPVDVSPREEVTGQAQMDMVTYETLAKAIGDDAMNELLGKVKSDIETSHVTLEQGLKVMNFKALRSATHVLISVAGAIGAVGLKEYAQKLNRAGNDSDEATMREDGPSMLAEITRVIAFVNARIKG